MTTFHLTEAAVSAATGLSDGRLHQLRRGRTQRSGGATYTEEPLLVFGTHYIKDPITGRLRYAKCSIDVINQRPISKPGRKSKNPG